MIKYYKLFDMLNRRDMKKTDLLDIISSPTLAKLSKGEVIKTDIIDKICKKLECQPSDIMEYIPDPEDKDKRKYVVISGKDELKDIMNDDIYDQIWERYTVYHEAIDKEMFKEIVDTCVGVKGKKIFINEDKLIMLLKRYADKTKLNL